MEVVLATAVLVALVDWFAVARDLRRVEVVAKPAAIAALTGVALLIDPVDDGQRALFVVALVLSLAGDVFLLMEERWFVAGLASFLVAHLAYIAGFAVAEPDAGAVLVGLAGTAILAVGIGRRIVTSAPAPLRVAVGVYVAVISLMVASAIGSRDPLAVAGAFTFYASDALIGWTRFVADLARGRLLVMVTYHVGQALLVLSLAAP